MTKADNKAIMTLDEYGNKVWKLGGKIHREDGPAIVYVKPWNLNSESLEEKWYFKGEEETKDV